MKAYRENKPGINRRKGQFLPLQPLRCIRAIPRKRTTATQFGQLVVVGDTGSILQSQIVPQTTQLQFLDFSVTPTEAVFLVGPTNEAIDLQFTIESSTNLFRWNTGPTLNLTSGALLFYLPFSSNQPPNQFYRTTLTGY